MLFSGKIRFHDVATLTARCVLFATICHYSPLFETIRTVHYSLFGFSRHPENDRGAVETSFLFLIACFYNKMFY